MMPYYIHLKDREVDTTTLSGHTALFMSKQDAYTNLPDPKTHTITFVPSEREIADWRCRERGRFNDHTYTKVPWHRRDENYCDYDCCPSCSIAIYQNHYAHISIEFPEMVAYTPTIEHGIQDRQIRVRPGKYLEEFYGSKNLMTRGEIQGYIEEMGAANQELQIARSPEDIVKIYSATDVGFSSCMQARNSPEYEWQRMVRRDPNRYQHPVLVYGDSDLGVAYRGTLDNPKQRAVVWPDQKQYVRIYGSGTLETLLERASYESVDSLDGARIRKVRHPNGGFYMPYVDGSGNCRESGQYLILDEDGPINAQTCNGCSQELFRCEDCEELFIELNDDDLCESCAESREPEEWMCDHCETTFNTSDHNSTYVANRGYWCNDCIEQETVTCSEEGCSTIWIEQSLLRSQREERRRHATTDTCVRCLAAHYQWCEACSALFDKREQTDTTLCPLCNQYPTRCQQTGDLLHENNVWWQDANQQGTDHTFWHWDGQRGWYTAEVQEWRLHPSELGSVTALDISSAYIRVADPRPSVQPSAPAALEDSIVF